MSDPGMLGPAGYGLGPGADAPLGQFNLGHVLSLLTGGNQFGGGFVGDMRGIGHSMMQHYRGNTTPGAGSGQSSPIVAPAAVAAPATPVTPALVPVGPGAAVAAPAFTATAAPAPGISLGQALSLLTNRR